MAGPRGRGACIDPGLTTMQPSGEFDLIARHFRRPPRRAIVVLITDFFEGGSEQRLVHLTRDLVAQGTRVLGLAALDDKAEPAMTAPLRVGIIGYGNRALLARVADEVPGDQEVPGVLHLLDHLEFVVETTLVLVDRVAQQPLHL